MYCQACGKECVDGTKFCHSCGTAVGVGAMSVPNTGGASPSRNEMSFGESIKTCFTKYADFNGRAIRSEYWWFYLFCTLCSLVAAVIDQSGILWAVVNLGLFLPTIAAATRRLHDTNRSGWWQLIVLTGIGAILLLIWLASKGTEGENDYGKLS